MTSTLSPNTTPTSTGKYGTFFGVYLPGVLSIFGVILYLRLGIILGQVGFVSTLSIICFASMITLITAFSLSAVATNMRVDKGGAYYIISRSLGIDFGTAIGIPLFLAQSIGIAFYIMGFGETMHTLLPHIDVRIINLSALVLLGAVGYFSTSWVLKTQLMIFLITIASGVSIFLGNPEPMFDLDMLPPLTTMGYWAAFAIFFPAVTGIETGISMSGVLHNPRKSLPLGTIATVLSALIVYLLLTCLLAARVPRQALVADPMILQHIARFGIVVLVAILFATLSSALGGILGAPRTLQALAEDGIVFSFLKKEHGVNKEPRIALLFTLALTGVFLCLGDINQIAPLLTMFFLISYGMLNLVAGLEAWMSNPSWRPTFVISPLISLSGGLCCVLAMLMINAGATILALTLVLLIYLFRGRKLSAKWDDMCFGIVMLVTKSLVHRLSLSGYAARSWRPHLLVFSPSATPDDALIAFTSHLTHGNSLLTFASIIDHDSPLNTETVKKTIGSSLKRHHLDAFITISKVKEPSEGRARYIYAHGLGPLTHNTVVFGCEGNGLELYPQSVFEAYQTGKNVLLVKSLNGRDEKKKGYQIDIWWDSTNRKTSELLLVLAHMYESNLKGQHTQITLKSMVSNETARDQRLKYFVEFFEKSRFNIDYKIYVAEEDEETKMIAHFSEEADFVFAGLPSPKEDDSFESYKESYRERVKLLKSLDHIALAVAAEPIHFEKIFS